MSEYRRFGGICFFFTVVTYKRQMIFQNAFARECLRDAWQSVAARRPFNVVAISLMPDHLHCIWRLPVEDRNYSIRWSQIKSLFTKYYLSGSTGELTQSDSRYNKRERGVWQRRFWEHRIRDDEDFNNHVHYIHRNPVKHGYVLSLDDWPWSTYHKYKARGQYDNFNWDVIDNLTVPCEYCDSRVGG